MKTVNDILFELGYRKHRYEVGDKFALPSSGFYSLAEVVSLQSQTLHPFDGSPFYYEIKLVSKDVNPIPFTLATYTENEILERVNEGVFKPI